MSNLTRRALQPALATLSPQCNAVLGHMASTGSISGLEASSIHRVRSLPRRILDIEAKLKETGLDQRFQIQRIRKKDVLKQRYTRYYLVKTK